jgi:succinoglycan biosynthesis protein ExoH
MRTVSSARLQDPASIGGELSLQIELARIFLICAIVFHHIRIPVELSFFTWDNLGYIRGYLQIGICKTATTALTVVSGYLLFSTSFEDAPSAFIRKKFWTLFVPLVVWNIPGAVLLYHLHAKGLHLDKYADLTHLGNWPNALLGLTYQPVNYPLHFLRNLIACNLVALLVARVFRKHAVGGLTLILVIGIFDLDGPILTRSDILIGFFLGAYIAVRRIQPGAIDLLFPFSAPAFLVSAFIMFYWQIDYETVWGLLHRLLSFFAVWPAIGYISRLGWNRLVVKKYSRFAFFTFLSHYYVSVGLFAAWSHFASLDLFLVYFVFACPLTIAICVAGQRLAQRIVPYPLGLVTGSRS